MYDLFKTEYNDENILICFSSIEVSTSALKAVSENLPKCHQRYKLTPAKVRVHAVHMMNTARHKAACIEGAKLSQALLEVLDLAFYNTNCESTDTYSHCKH